MARIYWRYRAHDRRGITVDGIEHVYPSHRFDRDAPAPLLLPVWLVDVSDAEAWTR